jgi:hypothetical protein
MLVMRTIRPKQHCELDWLSEEYDGGRDVKDLQSLKETLQAERLAVSEEVQYYKLAREAAKQNASSMKYQISHLQGLMKDRRAIERHGKNAS